MEMERYSVIRGKNPREIVLLRGSGCQWRRCRFCDYHLDFCKDAEKNYQLNAQVLAHVTGELGRLEVINSGSFCDLDEKTLLLIRQICVEKSITNIHFECHWMHRDLVEEFRKFWQEKGITLTLKIGVETFDELFRESYLVKGMDGATPEDIAQYFDEVCLLMGLPGQSVEQMIQDIETGLAHFRRVCVNIMVENTTAIRPDPRVIRLFLEEVYPKYKENERVDILLENTDFGVGGQKA